MKVIIVIQITTKDWSYGDIVSFGVKIDQRASSTYILWGNGKRNLLYPSSLDDRWTVVHHCYNTHGQCKTFTIALMTDTPESIRGVWCGLAEVDVDRVILSNCDGLVEFSCKNLPAATEFIKCPHLKKLVCPGFRGDEINLENLTGLEELDCSFSSLKSLNLSRNNNLVKLDCRYCKGLKTIVISNDSCLKDVFMWDSSPDFYKNSRLYLEKIVNQNNGTIYEDFRE